MPGLFANHPTQVMHSLPERVHTLLLKHWSSRDSHTGGNHDDVNVGPVAHQDASCHTPLTAEVCRPRPVVLTHDGAAPSGHQARITSTWQPASGTVLASETVPGVASVLQARISQLIKAADSTHLLGPSTLEAASALAAREALLGCI